MNPLSLSIAKKKADVAEYHSSIQQHRLTVQLATNYGWLLFYLSSKLCCAVRNFVAAVSFRLIDIVSLAGQKSSAQSRNDVLEAPQKRLRLSNIEK